VVLHIQSVEALDWASSHLCVVAVVAVVAVMVFGGVWWCLVVVA
jgi:hypothetical protein